MAQKRQLHSFTLLGLPDALEDMETVPLLVLPIRQMAMLSDQFACKIRGCGAITKMLRCFQSQDQYFDGV